MKKSNQLIGTCSFILMTLLFLSSCSTVSITSRRYNKGLHIEWASKSSKGLETNSDVKSKNTLVSKEINLEDNNSIDEALLLIEIQSLSEVNQTPVDLNSPPVPSLIVLAEKETNTSAKEILIEYRTVSKKNNLKSKTDKRGTKNKQMSDDLFFVLLILIALFIPPLAVYLFEESWTSRVTLNLILTIAAIVLGGIFWGSMGISLMIVPVIHALVVILKG